MIDEEVAHLVRELSSEQVPVRKRVSAARALAQTDSRAALDGLVHVATGDDVDEALSRAVGESVALMLIQLEQIDQVPLHDFSEPAFLAYDDTIARHQRGEVGRRSS